MKHIICTLFTCVSSDVNSHSKKVNPTQQFVIEITTPLREITCHMGLQCYLPPSRGDFTKFTSVEDGTQLGDLGGMQGWVDLGCGYIPREYTDQRCSLISEITKHCHGWELNPLLKVASPTSWPLHHRAQTVTHAATDELDIASNFVKSMVIKCHVTYSVITYQTVQLQTLKGPNTTTH